VSSRRRGGSNTVRANFAAVEGAQAALNALNRIDKEANKQAKEKVTEISRMMAREIAAAGNARRDPRDRFVAETVRAKRDRYPIVQIGYQKRMPVSRRGPGPRASDLVFGMEFGSNGNATDTPTRRGGRPGWRFPNRTPRAGASGNVGYWIFKKARAQQDRVVDLWAQALEDVAKEWTK